MDEKSQYNRCFKSIIPKRKFQNYQVGKDVGYGCPHYLTPEQTKKVSEFLLSINAEEVLEFALSQTFDDLLYPHKWPEDMIKSTKKPHWIISYMKYHSYYYKKAAKYKAGMLQAIM